MEWTKHVPWIIAASLLVSASAMAQYRAPDQPILEAERAALFPSARMIETGRTVASTACADCHGMDGMRTGEGQPYLAGQRSVYLYRVLKAYQDHSRDSEPMLHASSFLNDQALLAVSVYYASLTRPREHSMQEPSEAPGTLGDDPFSGIGEALEKCIKCHGETGNSTASGMPSLTAQHPEYFVSSMQAYVDGSRNHKLMKKLVGALDEQTIANMGLFYAVQEPLRAEDQGEGDAEAGRKIAEACANCHGSDGNASGSEMPSVAGQDASYFVKAMQAYKDGRRAHEAMYEAVEALGETEISDLAAFYASQTPVRRDVRTPFSTAEWVTRCERCHGLEGNSTDPRFPMLAGQHPEYLREAMKSYSTGRRSRSIMHAMSEPLSDNDVEQIVNYYATREPKSVVYMQLPCADQAAQ